MRPTTTRAILATLLFSMCAMLCGTELMQQPTRAATPSPRPISLPTPRLPTKKLHTEFLVEVNKKGQIVRVRSGKSCDNLMFNAQTYGNVLQMWIRHPDGTSEVGVYRVTYDYNPATHKIVRGVALVNAGGNWGDKEGAANEMMDIARRQAARQQRAQGTPPPAHLPSLESITGSRPHPSPTSHS